MKDMEPNNNENVDEDQPQQPPQTSLSEEDVLKLVRDYMKSGAFSDKKITDTPTESLQVVNRRYVTLNGASASRPTSSVLGQHYFDTDLGKPIWWQGTAFVDATGSVV